MLYVRHNPISGQLPIKGAAVNEWSIASGSNGRLGKPMELSPQSDGTNQVNTITVQPKDCRRRTGYSSHSKPTLGIRALVQRWLLTNPRGGGQPLLHGSSDSARTCCAVGSPASCVWGAGVDCKQASQRVESYLPYLICTADTIHH